MQGMFSVFPARSSVTEKFPLRCVHLDFHTDKAVYDIGSEFSEDVFLAHLKELGVEYATCFAMCNQGFAYYPTHIGIPHPGLKTDLLGRIAAANFTAGIKTCAYFSVGIANQICLRHPEWRKISKAGVAYVRSEPDPGALDSDKPIFMIPCLNSGYGDMLVKMVEEAMTDYPLDGLFFDNIGGKYNFEPCYCAACRKILEQDGRDPNNEDQARDLVARTVDKFRREILDLTKRLKPKGEFFTLTFNGLPYATQVSHAELEFPQTNFPFYADRMLHYLRALDKPFLAMICRFAKSWGDINGLGSDLALLYNFYKSISNGGSCMMGDHGDVRRMLEPAVYRMARPAFKEIQALEPWCSKVRAEADVAVLEPYVDDMPIYNRWHAAGGGVGGVDGAVKLLVELHAQFDVVSGAGNLEQYSVLILPDFVWVDKVLAEKLRLHLQRGGTIISSGYSGMRPDKSGFALDEYGLQYAGENPYHPIYIKVNGALMKDVPDMPLTIYPTERQGRQIVHGPMFINRSGAEVLATFWKPYFNSGDFDGTFLKHYSYCEKSIDRPAIVKAGNNIIHFSFPLFSGYAQHAVPVYRALFGNCLKMLHPDPLLVVAGLPVFAQINITAKNTERILHVISFLPEYKGQGNALGVESICLKDIRVSLKKRSKRACGAVYLAPSRQAIPFTQDQANIFFTIPKVEGYQMVVCD